MSGRHARVFREGNHYIVEDLKSTNGTFVNEKPIVRHTLLDRDVVLEGRRLHGDLDGRQDDGQRPADFRTS